MSAENISLNFRRDPSLEKLVRFISQQKPNFSLLSRDYEDKYSKTLSNMSELMGFFAELHFARCLDNYAADGNDLTGLGTGIQEIDQDTYLKHNWGYSYNINKETQPLLGFDYVHKEDIAELDGLFQLNGLPVVAEVKMTSIASQIRKGVSSQRLRRIDFALRKMFVDQEIGFLYVIPQNSGLEFGYLKSLGGYVTELPISTAEFRGEMRSRKSLFERVAAERGVLKPDADSV